MKRQCVWLLVGLLGMCLPTVAKAGDWVFEVVSLKREVEHRQDGGKIDGGSRSWTEVFEVPGAKLDPDSVIIHEVSRRNVKDLNIRQDGDRLIISGRTCWDGAFGAGGNYKATISVVFIRPVQTATPDQLQQFHARTRLPFKVFTSGDPAAIQARKDELKQQLINASKIK